MVKKVGLQEMTWTEVKVKLADCDVAILPIGGVEQHTRARRIRTYL